MLDFSRSRLPPFQHQREDTQALIDHPFFFITSEMRTGKTKIVIDAAQFMFNSGIIGKVLVIAPAPVRDVWFDKDIGELNKHLWLDTPATITEYHSKSRGWKNDIVIDGMFHPVIPESERLQFLVTNYEFLRSKNRLIQLLPFCGPRTLLVLDESSFVKNYAAEQSKACLQLRRACGRVVLLNGTPISHSPMDLFSQGNILHPKILDCKYITHFKARYAIMQAVLGQGGKPLTGPRGHSIQTVVGWRPEGLIDLQNRFAPYTVRRLQKDCLDLPPKLDSVPLTATLDAATWKIYKAMRDDLVVWLKSGDVAVASQAATKVMRLSQITSGFLGGIEDAGIDETMLDPEFLDSLDLGGYDGQRGNIPFDAAAGGNQITSDAAGADDRAVEKDISGASIHQQRGNATTEIGREKLDVLLWFLGQRLEQDDKLKVVVWSRFRAEAFRMLAEVEKTFPQFTTGCIVGAQKKEARLHALRLLKPETSPDAPVFVAGIEGTGSFGLDFTASHTCVTSSSGYSAGKNAQTLDRVYGPGQTEPVAYFDIIAVGPQGQKTIDHAIIAARRNADDIATWTSSRWVRALVEE